jgi:hypothetical protein
MDQSRDVIMGKIRKLKLSNDDFISNLRTEYNANIKLWIYEVTFRDQRSQLFLTMNTILLTALGILASFGQSIQTTAAIAILISLFAFSTCIMWRSILLKNSAYIEFRRFQLRSLEAKLQNITTFNNQWKSLNNYQELNFPELGESFMIGKSSRHSSTAVENNLPLILTIFWIVVFLAATIFLVKQFI